MRALSQSIPGLRGPRAGVRRVRVVVRRAASSGTLALGVLLAAGPMACEGCKGAGSVATTPPPDAPQSTTPTLRIYVVSDLAGALEPCGCVKDQLGGLNHAAAWIDRERAEAPTFVVAAAGPLFFMDPQV